MRHLHRPCGPQQPLKRAKGSRPAGNLDEHPQRGGVLDYRVPPEPLTFRRLQQVEPISQRPALRTRDQGLLLAWQAPPPAQPALRLLPGLLRSAALNEPSRQHLPPLGKRWPVRPRMLQHRPQHLAGTLCDLTSITAAPGHHADRASPAGPFTGPAAGIKMPALLRRYHGEYPLPGMMLFNNSSKLAALSPN